MNSRHTRRIQRAQELRERHAFAKEILSFYIEIARFQEGLGQHLPRISPKTNAGAELNATEIETLTRKFASFLAVVERHGNETLSDIARNLRASDKAWPQLLSSAWRAAAPTEPSLILAQAYLQPYAELAGSGRDLSPVQSKHAVCPFCHRKPCFGVLRQLGDGGSRSMVCAFCSCEWDFRRIVCPGCGEENEKHLPIYTADAFDYIRVECCDSCKTYIKTLDLTKNGNAEPLVDELASAPLDLWARDRGYAKLHNNLLGM